MIKEELIKVAESCEEMTLETMEECDLDAEDIDECFPYYCCKDIDIAGKSFKLICEIKLFSNI